MYERDSARIFSRSLFHKLAACGNLRRAKYTAAGIEDVLLDYFGDSRLSEASIDVLITSYEIERSFPFFFRSAIARERSDYDFPARQVARATSAAPTYFEPMKLPTGTFSHHSITTRSLTAAYSPTTPPPARWLRRAQHSRTPRISWWSRSEPASWPPALPYEQAKNWGAVRWATSVLDVVFDGVSRTVDYQLRQLLPGTSAQCKRYYRFQTTLDSATTTGSTTPVRKTSLP
jgi:hypothetical protein